MSDEYNCSFYKIGEEESPPCKQDYHFSMKQRLEYKNTQIGENVLEKKHVKLIQKVTSHSIYKIHIFSSSTLSETILKKNHSDAGSLPEIYV